jgi:hypothetical protein
MAVRLSTIGGAGGGGSAVIPVDAILLETIAANHLRYQTGFGQQAVYRRFTNAEVLAWPTAGAVPGIGSYDLIPARGVGTRIFPLHAFFNCEHFAGNYTGIDASAYILLSHGSGFSSNLGTLFESFAGQISGFFAGAGRQAQVSMITGGNAVAVGSDRMAVNTGSLAIDAVGYPRWSGELPQNTPWLAFCFNGIDFTGGNAANTLDIWVEYKVFNF